MTIEAPASRYNLKTLKIYIVACIIIAVVLAYDGFLSRYEWSMRYSFYKEHFVDNGQTADATMLFNQLVPFVLIALAVWMGIRVSILKNRKIVADDKGLTVVGGPEIPYTSVEQIDRTYFESKGYFVITYKKPQGGSSELKLSDRIYDNLPAILERLTAAIT